MLLGAIASAVAALAPSPTAVGDLRGLYERQKAADAAVKLNADAARQRLDSLATLRGMLPRPVRLEPDDLPVIELSDGRVSADALRALLANEACAVHVRGFMNTQECADISAALTSDRSAFTNWRINRGVTVGGDETSDDGTTSEVDKIGVTSGEALESYERFREYLDPSERRLEALLPDHLDPFAKLRAELSEVHPQGCRLDRLGGFTLPAGTFRCMRGSNGLCHADTATLLSPAAGEFSANIYIATPPGKGNLAVYPAQQYVGGGPAGLTNPMVIADLQQLARCQREGYAAAAQDVIRGALPCKRSLSLADGDLVLINTGRFHEVEPYEYDEAEGPRLSGQCWLSYRREKPLLMWV